MSIPQKSSCGRLEVAISPEYLSIRMNYCLLLSNSMVNGCICCFFHGRTAMCIMLDLVPQTLATKVIRSRNSFSPTQVSLILGPSLDQNRRKPQVMSLCWLVMAHRAITLARDAEAQRRRDTFPAETRGYNT